MEKDVLGDPVAQNFNNPFHRVNDMPIEEGIGKSFFRDFILGKKGNHKSIGLHTSARV